MQRLKMQINITTKYNIGDILYLQQTNGGGLRKVRVTGVQVFLGEFIALNEIKYQFDKVVYLNRRFQNTYTERRILLAAKYARRGRTWLTEKPPTKRKPITEQSYRKWLGETSTNNVRTNDAGEAAYQMWGDWSCIECLVS